MKIIIILALTLLPNVFCFTQTLHISSLVDNPMFLSDEYDNGYPEDKYHDVLDEFIKTYTPIIKELGGSFHILRDFTDGAVNAWAWRIGNEYHLEVPGGLSKYYLINEEAFIVTICHELGHLLGGAPINAQISYEGQSDYFATTHCAKRMLKKIKPFKQLDVSLEIKNLCQTQTDKKLCARLLNGSQSLSNYFAKLEKKPFPSLTNESTHIPRRTLRKHPKSQCRLDTLKRGSFCFAKFTDISNTDPHKGYCLGTNSRPACWYQE
jgi:hypothetical protein